MIINKYSQWVAFCSLAAFSFGTLAQEKPIAGPKWGAHVDLEAKPGSKRSLGEVDLFMPVAQDERTLVFTDLRARIDDQSNREGNIGFGVRRMLEDGWNLGGYAYFDRRRSADSGYYYNQATLGAEALGRDWDFRANGYIPQGTRVRNLGITGGVSSAALSGTSILVTTTASMAQEERALKGFDAEMGWRTPLFDSKARRQLRLYAGGYRFSDEVMTVEGPRLRAELAMEDLTWFGRGTALFLGAEAQHDNARGEQTFLSVRLRIPLGKESERVSPLNAQEQRMVAPVMRDVDIVTQSRSFVSTPGTVESATTADGQAFTVVNSATTTTTAALQTALNTAGGGSTVVLAGTFNTNAQINLSVGQTIIGGGALSVRTASGHAATANLPGATISRNAAPALSNVLRMNTNSSLIGMTLNGTSSSGGGYAVDAQGVSGVTLRNNTLSSSFTSGYVVDLMSSTNAVVTGNNIVATASTGAALAIRTESASNILIAGNTLSATGAPSYVVTGNQFTSFAANSSGNVAVNGTCIFSGGAPAGSVGFSTITCP